MPVITLKTNYQAYVDGDTLCVYCHKVECSCGQPTWRIGRWVLRRKPKSYCGGCTLCVNWPHTPKTRYALEHTYKLTKIGDICVALGVWILLMFLLLVMVSGCSDETCGFEDQRFQLQAHVVAGPCEDERYLMSFSEAAVPLHCVQTISYDECSPFVSRQCDAGNTRATWFLEMQSPDYYTGRLQVLSTYNNGFACTYFVTLEAFSEG